jgi:endonuclease/exonuclease/phosphatase family metal-dependent hydrolase
VITVLSYNVQRGGESGTSNEQILAEIDNADPDVIVLQEAAIDAQPLREHFDDWHFDHLGEFLVAARWPVRMKDICRPEAFGRPTAILYEVDHPDGAFLICNVHLTTARYGLAQLRPDSPISGRGVESLEVRQVLRESETFETRRFVADAGLETPLLAVGDFNMPTSSSLFQQSWSDLTSCFDAAGCGYGYTSPCNTDNLWPANTPWLRIDHILLSSHWNARSCWIGKTNGSDHRCIVARIQRR